MTRERDFILRSLMCARILQAITVLCHNFKKCCSTSGTDEWEKIRSSLTKTSLEFWSFWMEDVVEQITTLSSQLFNDMDVVKMLEIYQVGLI